MIAWTHNGHCGFNTVVSRAAFGNKKTRHYVEKVENRGKHRIIIISDEVIEDVKGEWQLADMELKRL